MFANPGSTSVKASSENGRLIWSPLGNMGSYENSGRTWYIASKIMQIASCATIHDSFTSPNLQTLFMMIYCFRHEDLARKESRDNTRAVPWWSWPRDEHKHIITRSQSNLLNTSWKGNLLKWSEATTHLCLFLSWGPEKRRHKKVKYSHQVKQSEAHPPLPSMSCTPEQTKDNKPVQKRWCIRSSRQNSNQGNFTAIQYILLELPHGRIVQEMEVTHR